MSDVDVEPGLPTPSDDIPPPQAPAQAPPPPPPPWWQVRLPNALTGLLLLLMSWFVIAQGRFHGRTYDEYMQDDYGARVLKFYLSWGEDRSFLDFPDYIYMPQHGSGAEVIVAFFQHLTGEVWQTRTMVCGAMGVLGILVMWLAGREMAGPWGGFAAALGLALYPRYTGQMPNNSKDIPLAGAMLLVLWLVLRLMRRWSQPDRKHEVLELAAIGAAIGFAASIRVTSLLWFGLLGLLALGYWVRNWRRLRGPALRAELSNQFSAAIVIAPTAYLVMSLLWPYLLTNPGDGLKASISSMSKYDWNHDIMFAGSWVRSTDLPWDFAPRWLIVGSPLPVVLLTLAAAVALVVALVRRQTLDGRLLLIGAYIVVPILMVIVAQATLYNGLRHFLFVVPGMLLLAATVLVRWVRQSFDSGRAVLAWALIGAAVLGQAEVVVSSARIYPYEYSYFSPLVGSYDRGHLNYENLYYGSCTRAAAVWMAENYQQYTDEANPTFRDENQWNTLAKADLPDNFVDIGDGQPLFRITSGEPGAGYREIHAEVLLGEKICRVSVLDPTVY
ncbi:glycosyltransferase family 39 protein [Catellatospora sp. KI3]|uniref:glycosyltransferase family 39 protein n=1 Tax=Catellatospora sp. KI3 TaxID=3041620 RepID=UPI002482FD21|nr:glycosyltransferase family 39 protein [Catellatospora sp. KI3]MDI1466033.1 glycosyltransferase family 39 protein [Catellatospora sp. KI3]